MDLTALQQALQQVEDHPELLRLAEDVVKEPDELEPWEALVRCSENQEGGLNRNSSPAAIGVHHSVYDQFLLKFPLFFGYWKKYADLEFSIGGTEAAELIYERAVGSIPNSVDIWAHYCNFKAETCHDADTVRELFERGADAVGLDFQSHTFWDAWIAYEERMEAPERIFAIHSRIIHIPLAQSPRYFQKHNDLMETRPVNELVDESTLTELMNDVRQTGIINDLEFERELRQRISGLLVDLYHRTNHEVEKRLPFENVIQPSYFHVRELPEEQLVNWRKYLAFEEVEGNPYRVVFLYERCLVACARYEEFWLRYARWMLAQGKQQDVRIIYQRASCLHISIARPFVRFQWAWFEESIDRVDIAQGIYESILMTLPGHRETIVNLANLKRRQEGIDAALAVYENQVELNRIQAQDASVHPNGELVVDWANMLEKIKGSPEEARALYQQKSTWYLDSMAFWTGWLRFELRSRKGTEDVSHRVPQSGATPLASHDVQHTRIQKVVKHIRSSTRLPLDLVRDAVKEYMTYLSEHGSKEAAAEYMQLDKDVFGPYSINNILKTRTADDGDPNTTERRLVLENGHLGVEINEADRQDINPYIRYYQEQGAMPFTANGQVTHYQ